MNYWLLAKNNQQMQSGYLDTKYIRMNKAGMKGDYFYVMDYDVR